MFALFPALERKNIELRDFSSETAATTVGPGTRPYRPVPATPEPSQTRRNLRAAGSAKRGAEGRRRQSKTSSTPVSSGLPSSSNPSPTKHLSVLALGGSLDSGFYDNSLHVSPAKIRPGVPEDVNDGTLTVQRTLNRGVAVVG